MLQKANLAAELYGYETEFELSRCFRYATNGKIPLDDQGNSVWPKVGDDASLFLSMRVVLQKQFLASQLSMGLSIREMW
jgi:hypothetical protein